jgi:hypothetical protein
VKKHGKPDWDANVISNILLADEYLNQRVIRASAPKEWVGQFSRKSSSLEESFLTHLIGTGALNALQTNSYPKFIENRASALFDAATAYL